MVRILDEADHQAAYNGRAGIDDLVPPIAHVKERIRNGPDDAGGTYEAEGVDVPSKRAQLVAMHEGL